MSSIKKGEIYVDENGQVMTVQKTDDTGIHVDEEGTKKRFMDETEFEEYRKKKKYEKSNVTMGDEFPEEEDGEEDDSEEEIPEPPEEDSEEEEDEIPEPPEEDEPAEEEEEVSKKERFKDLYLQMLDLGATGNDKIDKAVEKLKKELSSELNTMTSESWDQIEEQLKREGYIK